MKLVVAAAWIGALGLGAQEIQLSQVAAGITGPTDIQNAGDGSGRLFLVQQNGVIRILRNGALLSTPFLDISSRTRADGERGLLGLAFPPGFAQSQHFYVDYTDLNGDTVIAQYRLTANPDVADRASEIVLLHIAQPFANHNGGQVRFGPDGYLYIGMGDGGSAGDPMRNAQNLSSLLGKMLRIDVESAPGQVRIPPDNPFAGMGGARGEIWAYGLRNPWRFTFDSATRDLWIGDVGQDLFEEIDFQPASSHGGENYGWNRMEGAHCYQVTPCSQQGLTLPVLEYSRLEGCSVIGGFLYRGRGSPGLRGTYVYGDLCSGSIWGLTHEGSQWMNRKLASTNFSITTFGLDEAGEMYVSNGNTGTIYRIVGSQAPRITPGGVTNPASFAPGMTAGSLATVFVYGVLDTPGGVVANQVPLATSLNGVGVMVNGIAAPVYSLANAGGLELVSFQVPFEVAGMSNANVVVTRNGQSSAAVSVPLLETQPGVYSTDGTQGIAVHAVDYTLATTERPLQRGEDAFVYAAGLGRVTSPPRTGEGAPGLPPVAVVGDVSVSIGGVSCPLEFAGLAPGFVGVYQVNFRVADGVPSGVSDLVVKEGAAAGPPVKVVVK